MTVDVTARQYAWSFKYPDAGNVTAPVLRLPLGEATELEMSSLDVIHAFWVPEFRQNQYMVPGETTSLLITPTRLGTYALICNELCELGHVLMRSEAIVMRPADYARWEEQQRTALAEAARPEGQERLSLERLQRLSHPGRRRGNRQGWP